jgi:AraC family transcriptional regulator
MSDHGAYGKHLGEVFHVGTAPSFVTRSLRKTEIAVTEIKCELVDFERTLPLQQENSFLVNLQVRDLPKRKVWRDGKPLDASPLKGGTVSIFDLRREWIAERVAPLHLIAFYLPRRALDAIADMEGVAHLDHFNHDPAIGVPDATIAILGMSLLPAFERPDEANHLFVDHVTCAAAIHILRAYGVGKAASKHLGNRLSPWQLQRAKDVLMADLSGDVSVAQLAAECGLSISKYTKGFALSTGLPPHKWLLEQRVHRSMCMLRDRDVPFDEIAMACGFFDARHFVRVFTRMVGTHPRTWQRAIRH